MWGDGEGRGEREDSWRSCPGVFLNQVFLEGFLISERLGKWMGQVGV